MRALAAALSALSFSALATSTDTDPAQFRADARHSGIYHGSRRRRADQWL